MNDRISISSLLVAMFSLAGSAFAAAPDAVAVTTFDWHDTARDRAVPVKIYSPAKGAGPWPVILFSHGLGGSRDGYEYLGRCWASHGYVSVHIQHVGSDTSVWKGQGREAMGAMKRASADPQNLIQRPQDVTFAINQLEKLNAQAGAFKGRLDLKHIGMAGHSFGAYTTLAVAGELFTVAGRDRSLADPRIKAAIAMSSPAPRDRTDDDLDHAFSKIVVPVFHMTGTEDASVIRDTTPAQRRIPFDHSCDQRYLVTFAGADHAIFSGFNRNLSAEKGQRIQSLICHATVAFWDAFLKDDPKARAYLDEGGFEKDLAADGKFEKKARP